MENKTKKNSPLVYFILMFIVAVFFELYWINIHPYDYFMLIGIGLVVLITGYLSFDGIIKMKNAADDLRREQNETMIKAQKAIYLATKKNAAEAENMQIQSLKAINVLMDRMVEAITEKQIEANSSSGESEDISAIINQLTESNAKLVREVQSAITVNQLVKANEDLIKNVQNVLSGQPVSLAETTAAKTIVTREPVKVPEPVVIPEPTVTPEPVITPEPVEVPEPVITPEPVEIPEPAVTPEPVTTPEPVEVPEPNISPEPFETPESIPEEIPVAEDFDTSTDNNPLHISEEFINLATGTDDSDDDTINIDDITLEELDDINSAPSPLPEIQDDDISDITTEEAIESDIAVAEAAAADASQTIEAIEAASEPDETIDEPEVSVIAEDMEDNDDSSAMEDEDDNSAMASALEKGPNDALSPEEIAALFANL